MAMQKKYQFSTENVRIVASWKANIPKLLQQNAYKCLGGHEKCVN